MAYTDFTLDNVEGALGLTLVTGSIFPQLTAVTTPAWLADTLARGAELALTSEKARSEFIVAPLLLAVRELAQKTVAIFSGQRLDVDPERRLLGECDFLLARTDTVPRLRAPLMAVVEAKKNDIELGIGQCAAQMFAAWLFNERAKQPIADVYGCVTTGEDWQFLRLTGTIITLHRPRFYISNLGLLLAAFQNIVNETNTSTTTP